MVLMGLYHGTETNLNFFVGTANKKIEYFGTENQGGTGARVPVGRAGGRQQLGVAQGKICKRETFRQHAHRPHQ
jgi:hypothetical protein